MGDRQGKLQILTFVVRYTSPLGHTKIEGNNRLAGGESKDRSKCKDVERQGREYKEVSTNIFHNENSPPADLRTQIFHL